MSGLPVNLCDTIMNMTRTVTGSTEVMSGEAVGSVSSAMGISLLQEAAKHPINNLREGFWATKKKQGLVLAQFFRLFYQNKEYVTEVEEKGEDGTTQKTRRLGTFNGSMLEGMRYDVVCEATVGTNSSSAGTIALLDQLFSGGHIDLKTYVRLYPDDALTNKKELEETVEAMEKSQLAVAQSELAQVRAELERCMAAMAEDEKLIDKVKSIINQNKDLSLMLAGLYAESSEKLAAANEQINAGNAKINEQQADLMEAVEDLAKLQGIDLAALGQRLMAQAEPPAAG